MKKYLIKVNIEREIEAQDEEQALSNFFEIVGFYNDIAKGGCDIIEDNLEIEEINTPKEYERRVAVCEHTKKKIVQEWTGKEWLCLHNENEELDKKEVEEFEAKQNNK